MIFLKHNHSFTYDFAEVGNLITNWNNKKSDKNSHDNILKYHIATVTFFTSAKDSNV